MPIVSPGPRLILSKPRRGAYGDGIGRFFGHVDNSRGSKRDLTRPRPKLRQRHTIVLVAISVLMEISPGGLLPASNIGLILESASGAREWRILKTAVEDKERAFLLERMADRKSTRLNSSH